jgi:hypothetical protein
MIGSLGDLFIFFPNINNRETYLKKKKKKKKEKEKEKKKKKKEKILAKKWKKILARLQLSIIDCS